MRSYKKRSERSGKLEVRVGIAPRQEDPIFAELYLHEFPSDFVDQGVILKLLERAFQRATWLEFWSSG